MSAKPIARICDCKGSEIFLIKQIFDKKTERFVQPPRWIGLLLLMSFTHKQ